MIFYEQVIPNVIKSHEWTSWTFSAHIFFATYSKSKNKSSLFWAIKYFFFSAAKPNNAPENDLFFDDKKSTSPVPVWLTSALADLASRWDSKILFFSFENCSKWFRRRPKLICSNLFSRLRSHGQCSVVSFRLDGDSGRERLRKTDRERERKNNRERQRKTETERHRINSWKDLETLTAKLEREKFKDYRPRKREIQRL